VGVYRPSSLIRWPLHLMNGLLVVAILAVAGCVAAFRLVGLEPPWALAIVGAGVCVVLLFVNLAAAGLRLVVNERGVSLRVWPWRRLVPWEGAEVERIEGPDGISGARIRGGGKALWLSAAWFRDFEVAMSEIEAGAARRGNGG